MPQLDRYRDAEADADADTNADAKALSRKSPPMSVIGAFIPYSTFMMLRECR